jgi:hypothetical protein
VDFQLINLRLMSHPLNWLFVWVVLAIVTMAYTHIHDHIVATSADASIAPD